MIDYNTIIGLLHTQTQMFTFDLVETHLHRIARYQQLRPDDGKYCVFIMYTCKYYISSLTILTLFTSQCIHNVIVYSFYTVAKMRLTWVGGQAKVLAKSWWWKKLSHCITFRLNSFEHKLSYLLCDIFAFFVQFYFYFPRGWEKSFDLIQWKRMVSREWMMGKVSRVKSCSLVFCCVTRIIFG